MSKKIKFISGILTVVFAGTLMCGCGSSDSSSTSDTIVVWSNLMDNEIEALDDIAKEWAKENNKKVKVVKDDSGYQEFLQAANY